MTDSQKNLVKTLRENRVTEKTKKIWCFCVQKKIKYFLPNRLVYRPELDKFSCILLKKVKGFWTSRTLSLKNFSANNLAISRLTLFLPRMG